MLDELEKLAREATAPPWTSDMAKVAIVDRSSQRALSNATYICALVNSAPLLLAAVKAAEARPWLHRGQPPDPMIFGCDGCAGSIIDGDYIHGDGCDYRHIDAALDALKGSK